MPVCQSLSSGSGPYLTGVASPSRLGRPTPLMAFGNATPFPDRGSVRQRSGIWRWATRNIRGSGRAGIVPRAVHCSSCVTGFPAEVLQRNKDLRGSTPAVMKTATDSAAGDSGHHPRVARVCDLMRGPTERLSRLFLLKVNTAALVKV
jgi:hypothetical protein